MLEGLSGATLVYPIIGDPIGFVKSPPRMTRRFEARGHDGICVPLQVPAAGLDAAMRGLALMGNVDGMLVTMPHKFAAFAYCATSTERARLLGVVNVMRRNGDGTWHGDMLDGLAFVKAQRDAGARIAGARALLVGAGGAGSAIGIALLEAGAREVMVHDRDAGRAAALVALLAGIGRGGARVGTADPAGCDLVCNATPMGMGAGDPLPVAAARLAASMFVGDVVAGHGVTPLLQAARAAGCGTADGVQMVDAGMEAMVDFMLRAEGEG
jgi:shikimate dehydrogenase